MSDQGQGPQYPRDLPRPQRKHTAGWAIVAAVSLLVGLVVVGILVIHGQNDSLRGQVSSLQAQSQAQAAQERALVAAEHQLVQTQHGATVAHLGICWNTTSGNLTDSTGSQIEYVNGLDIEPPQIVSGVYQCESGFTFASVVPAVMPAGGGGPGQP